MDLAAFKAVAGRAERLGCVRFTRISASFTAPFLKRRFLFETTWRCTEFWTAFRLPIVIRASNSATYMNAPFRHGAVQSCFWESSYTNRRALELRPPRLSRVTSEMAQRFLLAGRRSPLYTKKRGRAHPSSFCFAGFTASREARIPFSTSRDTAPRGLGHRRTPVRACPLRHRLPHRSASTCRNPPISRAGSESWPHAHARLQGRPPMP